MSVDKVFRGFRMIRLTQEQQRNLESIRVWGDDDAFDALLELFTLHVVSFVGNVYSHAEFSQSLKRGSVSRVNLNMPHKPVSFMRQGADFLDLFLVCCAHDIHVPFFSTH